MPISRCSEQFDCSLEEFYAELSTNTVYDWENSGKAMLELISGISKLFRKTHIWGLTSHERLILQSVDNSTSAWYVTIGTSMVGEYYFDYLMPAKKRPWVNAQVRGEAQSLSEAEKYLLIAMRECEGWLGNEELSRLLLERNL